MGGPTDLGWVLFYVCWGAAALHPSMRDLTVEQPRRVRHLRPVTLLLLSAAALPAPLAHRLAGRRPACPDDAGVLAGASAGVFVLVMLRLTGLARAQAIYARREQALRSFSERLVAATERSDVWKAAVDAVVAIGAAGVTGCVVTDTEAVGDGDRRRHAGPTLVGAAVDVAAFDGRATADRSVSPMAGR